MGAGVWSAALTQTCLTGLAEWLFLLPVWGLGFLVSVWMWNGTVDAVYGVLILTINC